jgi:hypothetical protein
MLNKLLSALKRHLRILKRIMTESVGSKEEPLRKKVESVGEWFP